MPRPAAREKNPASFACRGFAPAAGGFTAFEEGVAVGIEERAAVGRETHGLVLHAAVDGTEGGQQTRPCIVAAFENFLAVLVGAFAQEFPQGGDGVVLIEKRIAEQEQAAFLRGEEEDEPHHHGEGGIIDFLFRDGGEQGAVGFGVDLIKGGDEHFHGAADLAAELVGDFLLVLGALCVEGSERFPGGDAEEAAQAKQAVEGPQGDGFLHPDVRIPRGEAAGLAAGRVNDHPVLAIGDESERDAGGVEQLGHAGGR